MGGSLGGYQVGEMRVKGLLLPSLTEYDVPTNTERTVKGRKWSDKIFRKVGELLNELINESSVDNMLYQHESALMGDIAESSKTDNTECCST